MSKVCKWLADTEVCVNADCPVCTDFCLLGEYQEICKYAEMVEENDNGR